MGYWEWVQRVFREAKSQAAGGQRWNRTTDTGIFRLISLPLEFDKRHEYCTLAEMVWVVDGGNVEIYTCFSTFEIASNFIFQYLMRA